MFLNSFPSSVNSPQRATPPDARPAPFPVFGLKVLVVQSARQSPEEKERSEFVKKRLAMFDPQGPNASSR